MQHITQHKTATPTTETKNYPVGTFWKDTRYMWTKVYAIISLSCVIRITRIGSETSIEIKDGLTGFDSPDEQIQDTEFSAEYESCQLAIVDAFQTAFPQAVNLEMSER